MYKNDKVEFLMERQGVRFNILFENCKDNESLDVAYFFYTEPKIYIETEAITTNKKLIEHYDQEYQLKAFEKNKNKHDIHYDRNDFKIVNENKNGKMYFYY